MKKLSFPIAIVVALTLGVSLVFAAGMLNLPTDPVTITHGPWLGNAPDSSIEITLSDVPAGFDVMNGPYDGWCTEDNGQANAPQMLGTLHEPTGLLWEQVNWVLNNWGSYGDYFDAQIAIWMLTGTNQHAVTAAAQALYDDAIAFGGGFMPGPGQVVAVVAFSDTFGGADMYQDTIIEVPLPPDEDGEGCTPGYWRNLRQHGDEWGIAFDTLFSDVFGVGPDMEFADAVRLGGGGEKALIRHGAAAYLNAISPNVAYFYTPAEVIQIVQDAYATGDFTEAKDLLEAQNGDLTFCPID